MSSIRSSDPASGVGTINTTVVAPGDNLVATGDKTLLMTPDLPTMGTVTPSFDTKTGTPGLLVGRTKPSTVTTPRFDLAGAVDNPAFAGRDPGTLEVPAALLHTLEAARTVVITAHIMPDGDGVGSALSMARALRALGKQVAQASCGAEESEHKRSRRERPEREYQQLRRLRSGAKPCAQQRDAPWHLHRGGDHDGEHPLHGVLPRSGHHETDAQPGKRAHARPRTGDLSLLLPWHASR